jgi:hypothetical protein
MLSHRQLTAGLAVSASEKHPIALTGVCGRRLGLSDSGIHPVGAIMAAGTRIMYRSTDVGGNPNAVTGTYIERAPAT